MIDSDGMCIFILNFAPYLADDVGASQIIPNRLIPERIASGVLVTASKALPNMHPQTSTSSRDVSVAADYYFCFSPKNLLLLRY